MMQYAVPMAIRIRNLEKIKFKTVLLLRIYLCHYFCYGIMNDIYHTLCRSTSPK